MIEWETGEITSEPLPIIAADDPIACAIYAKKMIYSIQKDGRYLKASLKGRRNSYE